jgi:hypothetical protein
MDPISHGNVDYWCNAVDRAYARSLVEPSHNDAPIPFRLTEAAETLCVLDGAHLALAAQGLSPEDVPIPFLLTDSADSFAPHEQPKQKRSCNLHYDCDIADEKANRVGGISAQHCHDECCDECFGN